MKVRQGPHSTLICSWPGHSSIDHLIPAQRNQSSKSPQPKTSLPVPNSQLVSLHLDIPDVRELFFPIGAFPGAPNLHFELLDAVQLLLDFSILLLKSSEEVRHLQGCRARITSPIQVEVLQLFPAFTQLCSSRPPLRGLLPSCRPLIIPAKQQGIELVPCHPSGPLRKDPLSE